jgi:nucleotide-binding universal stress UspA family protein
MFQHILCPIDFTSFSDRAVRQAIAIARCYGAAITGIHVIEHHCARSTVREAIDPYPTTADLTRLQTHLLKVLQEADAPSPTGVTVCGDPAAEIVKLAGSLPADLIVLGARGRTGLADGTCGSVTAEVLCHAPSPVITVPHTWESSAPAGQKVFRRIACAIDFSPASLKGLRYASALAEACRSTLLVSHVMESETAFASIPNRFGSPEPRTAESSWRHRLHEAAARDLPQGAEVQERLMTGDPASEILRLAQEESADLIVIGGHRGNPPGCVMNAVVTRARCPVLAVRVSR